VTTRGRSPGCVDGDQTSEMLLNASNADPFDLSGAMLSYGPDKNQGSDQVFSPITQGGGSFKPVLGLIKIAEQ